MSFGNWHIKQDPVNWDGRGYQGICTVPAVRKGTHCGEMFAANARLITAAPDLLDALQNLYGQVLQAKEGFGVYAISPSMDESIHNAEIAIAKATGTQS
jgi:hypothetical protein